MESIILERLLPFLFPSWACRHGSLLRSLVFLSWSGDHFPRKIYCQLSWRLTPRPKPKENSQLRQENTGSAKERKELYFWGVQYSQRDYHPEHEWQDLGRGFKYIPRKEEILGAHINRGDNASIRWWKEQLQPHKTGAAPVDLWHGTYSIFSSNVTWVISIVFL